MKLKNGMSKTFYILKGFAFGVFFGNYTYIHKSLCIIAMWAMVFFMIVDIAYFVDERD